MIAREVALLVRDVAKWALAVSGPALMSGRGGSAPATAPRRT
ncbi:MAG TPA: hypothetical protein VNS46_20520 [Nocardioides sp.]|nr:hypothetical protein [Nocardioides sp.]